MWRGRKALRGSAWRRCLKKKAGCEEKQKKSFISKPKRKKAKKLLVWENGPNIFVDSPYPRVIHS